MLAHVRGAHDARRSEGAQGRAKQAKGEGKRRRVRREEEGNEKCKDNDNPTVFFIKQALFVEPLVVKICTIIRRSVEIQP